MKYDFDQLIDRRGTHSSKHENNLAMFGTDDVLDMWVADMDLPSPEPVVKALQERAAHPVYGYTFPPSSLYDVIVQRMERLYGWKIKREWIVFSAGVVNGLYSCVQAVTHPGDEVIVQPPVYYPFYSAVKHNGCQIVHNPLKLENGRYTMDFEGLERLFAGQVSFPVRAPRIKALILCSPHNPVGRAWTAEELAKLAEICLKHNCLIISDEIHCDLLTAGVQHVATSSLSEQIEQQTITLMSGSKTYNIAGLATSFLIIPNADIRRRFVELRAGRNSGNIFGLLATEVALRDDDDYLAQLNAYLDQNRQFFYQYIRTNIPKLDVVEAEGTYLAWVDMRKLGMEPLELQSFMRQKARLALDDGYAFGPGGEGFQRFNLACPRSVVEEALRRLECAVNSL